MSLVENHANFKGQNLKTIPKIPNKETIIFLDLSDNPITSFNNNLNQLKTLRFLCIDNTQITSFHHAPELPSLIEFTCRGTPLASLQYLGLMSLIVFCKNVKMVNGQNSDNNIVSLANMLRKDYRKHLVDGFIITSLSPFKLFNSETRQRKSAFLEISKFIDEKPTHNETKGLKRSISKNKNFLSEEEVIRPPSIQSSEYKVYEKQLKSQFALMSSRIMASTLDQRTGKRDVLKSDFGVKRTQSLTPAAANTILRDGNKGPTSNFNQNPDFKKNIKNKSDDLRRRKTLDAKELSLEKHSTEQKIGNARSNIESLRISKKDDISTTAQKANLKLSKSNKAIKNSPTLEKEIPAKNIISKTTIHKDMPSDVERKKVLPPKDTIVTNHKQPNQKKDYSKSFNHENQMNKSITEPSKLEMKSTQSSSLTSSSKLQSPVKSNSKKQSIPDSKNEKSLSLAQQTKKISVPSSSQNPLTENKLVKKGNFGQSQQKNPNEPGTKNAITNQEENGSFQNFEDSKSLQQNNLTLSNTLSSTNANKQENSTNPNLEHNIPQATNSTCPNITTEVNTDNLIQKQPENTISQDSDVFEVEKREISLFQENQNFAQFSNEQDKLINEKNINLQQDNKQEEEENSDSFDFEQQISEEKPANPFNSESSTQNVKINFHDSPNDILSPPELLPVNEDESLSDDLNNIIWLPVNDSDSNSDNVVIENGEAIHLLEESDD